MVVVKRFRTIIALVAIAAAASSFFWLPQLFIGGGSQLTRVEVTRDQLEEQFRSSLVSLLVLGTVVTTAYVALRQFSLAQRRQNLDRFDAALQGLASDNPVIR